MTARYHSDDEIITAACVIPSDMIASSGRAPPERAKQMKQLHDYGIDVCMVVWLDDTIAFISYDANSGMPPAAIIINAYREHHHLPKQKPETGNVN